MRIDNSISLISELREKLNKRLVVELEKRGVKGIVPSHGNLIMYLYKHVTATKTELSENIGKGKSTVTKLLTKLIKFGYVDTKENSEDKRSDLVFLTEKGKELIPIIFVISEEIFEKAYGNFLDIEREEFLRLLNKLNDNLDNNFS